MTVDDDMAREHLAQERRRAAFQRSLQAKLAAPPGPLKDLKEKMRPVLKTGTWPRPWR